MLETAGAFFPVLGGAERSVFLISHKVQQARLVSLTG